MRTRGSGEECHHQRMACRLPKAAAVPAFPLTHTRLTPHPSADSVTAEAASQRRLFQTIPGSFGKAPSGPAIGLVLRWRGLSGRFQELDGGADQLGQIAGLQLVLELGADIDDGLVADMQLVGDIAVRLALGQKR